MNENSLDWNLPELVLKARRYPPGSRERQKLMTDLISKIWQSNQLGHPQAGQWPADVYEDLYDEALQKTFFEICQSPERFRPEYPVMAWVNSTLDFKFKEAVQEKRRTKNKLKGQDEPIKIISLQDLENFIDLQIEQRSSNYEVIIRFLRKNPDKLLSQSMRNRPDITFRYLLLQRLKDKSWLDISKKKGVPISTLSSFFYRKFEQLKPYLRKYLDKCFF